MKNKVALPMRLFKGICARCGAEQDIGGEPGEYKVRGHVDFDDLEAAIDAASRGWNQNCPGSDKPPAEIVT